jgi:hypothetical protein
MGCNCGKRQQVILNPKPVEELPITLTGMTYDWYNNIDEIEPIKPKDNE